MGKGSKNDPKQVPRYPAPTDVRLGDRYRRWGFVCYLKKNMGLVSKPSTPIYVVILRSLGLICGVTPKIWILSSWMLIRGWDKNVVSCMQNTLGSWEIFCLVWDWSMIARARHPTSRIEQSLPGIGIGRDNVTTQSSSLFKLRRYSRYLRKQFYLPRPNKRLDSLSLDLQHFLVHWKNLSTPVPFQLQKEIGFQRHSAEEMQAIKSLRLVPLDLQ